MSVKKWVAVLVGNEVGLIVGEGDGVFVGIAVAVCDGSTVSCDICVPSGNIMGAEVGESPSGKKKGEIKVEPKRTQIVIPAELISINR